MDSVVSVASEKLTPLLDYAINRYLQADPPLVASSLQAMSGKVIGLSLTVPKLEFFLLIKEDAIRVSTEYQGQADTWIRGSFFDLLKLNAGDSVDREDGAPAVHLEIVGDVHLGQKLQRLFTEIEFDWEALLVPAIGDIGAHQVGKGVRAVGGLVNRSIESLSFSCGEFLQEELKITPTRQEIDCFIDNVEKLRDAVERIDARLQRVKSQAEKT